MNRDTHLKFGPSWLGFHLHFPLMLLVHDLAHHFQSQSGAFAALRLLGIYLHERPEQFSLIFLTDADTTVFDAHHKLYLVVGQFLDL